MAKKKNKSRADSVRHAVDQAFQSQVPRERVQELVDELAQTAGRLRGAVDELRPASAQEVEALRDDVAALRRRIDALESAPKPKPAARKPAARKPAAGKAPAKPPRSSS